MDLGREGDASRVSRHQARLALRPDGAFTVTNCGRRKLHVNGCQVRTYDRTVAEGSHSTPYFSVPAIVRPLLPGRIASCAQAALLPKRPIASA